MNIAIIVAADENGVIGAQGKLPWRLSDDLKNFKKLTTGKIVVMGRKTFDSIGKPLPNRHNIVLTRDKSFNREGIETFHGVDDFLASMPPESDVCIIGGEEIYKQFLYVTDEVYLTRVYCKVENGDAFFEFDPSKGWELMTADFRSKDENNEHDFAFLKYERRTPYGK
jgi:dihydrofolate reductase